MANPRKPDGRKRLAGTLRRDRMVRAAGERLAKCPPPPRHLSDSAVAEWKRLAPILHRLGLLTEGDLRALELLCDTLATAAEAAKVVRRDGMTVSTADGGKKSHPAIRVMETARSQAAGLLAQFGLTPRSKNHVEPAPAPGSTAAPWEGRYFT